MLAFAGTPRKIIKLRRAGGHSYGELGSLPATRLKPWPHLTVRARRQAFCLPNSKPIIDLRVSSDLPAQGGQNGTPGRRMHLANQTLCRRCGRGMETVAEIAPFGGRPGLVAFLCSSCGRTKSSLVYNVNINRQVDHEQRGPGDKH